MVLALQTVFRLKNKLIMIHARSMLFVLALGCSSLMAETTENLLDNGTFSADKHGWRTPPSAMIVKVNDSAQKALCIKLDKKKNVSFSQAVKLNAKTRVLNISFKVKPGKGFTTTTPSVGALVVKIHHDSHFIYREHQVAASEEFQEITWTLGELGGARQVTLEVEINPGTGELIFDDVVIEPKDG